VGNVGDNTLSSYSLRASETQQLSYIPDGRAPRHTRLLSAWLLGGSRRPMTGRLATHPGYRFTPFTVLTAIVYFDFDDQC